MSFCATARAPLSSANWYWTLTSSCDSVQGTTRGLVWLNILFSPYKHRLIHVYGSDPLVQDLDGRRQCVRTQHRRYERRRFHEPDRLRKHKYFLLFKDLGNFAGQCDEP